MWRIKQWKCTATTVLDVVISHEHGKKQKDLKKTLQISTFKNEVKFDPFCSLKFFQRSLCQKNQ